MSPNSGKKTSRNQKTDASLRNPADLPDCPDSRKFESTKIGEAFPGNRYPGKEYDVEEIPTALARERLEAIGLPGMTKISLFRLSGERRLFGLRSGNVFHVVWWDSKHEIWPSPKKHT